MKQKCFYKKFQSLFIGSLLLTGSAHAAPLYVFTDLGTGTGTGSEAFSINNAGQVVGRTWSDFYRSDSRPTLWYDGTATDLNASDGWHGAAYGINNSGSIGGWSYSIAPSYGQFPSASIWNGATRTDFVGYSLYGSSSYGLAINDNGDIVGASYDTYDDISFYYETAALWSNGSYADLGTLYSNGRSQARSINDSQVIVGGSSMPFTGSNVQFSHATLWDHGAMIDLGALGGGFLDGAINGSEALDINNLGQTVGYSLIASNWDSYSEQRATLWVGTTIIDLGTWGGSGSAAYAINNLGQIVGYSFGLGPVLYENGIATNLNTLFDSASLGTDWTLVPNDINDNGAIAGSAHNSVTREVRAFLLTPEPLQPAEFVPVSAPETYSLVLIGAGIMAFNRSRRTYLRKAIHGSLGG